MMPASSNGSPIARTANWLPLQQAIGRNIEAVRAAITQLWSTSPVEGQINRLKTMKRQMYGRSDIHC